MERFHILDMRRVCFRGMVKFDVVFQENALVFTFIDEMINLLPVYIANFSWMDLLIWFRPVIDGNG